MDGKEAVQSQFPLKVLVSWIVSAVPDQAIGYRGTQMEHHPLELRES